MKSPLFIAALFFNAVFACTPAISAPSGDPYLKDIKPLLKEKCFACHGGLKQKAGLRLDTAALIKKGGESGSAIDVTKPNFSLILQRITHPDEAERMPQESAALSKDQIAMIQKWISQGAFAPKNELQETDPRDHWSFRKIKRPALPKVDLEVRNEIDHFVYAELANRNLIASSEAPKPVLLRRMYLDLVGVPPTREELHAFLADKSTAAY